MNKKNLFLIIILLNVLLSCNQNNSTSINGNYDVIKIEWKDTLGYFFKNSTIHSDKQLLTMFLFDTIFKDFSKIQKCVITNDSIYFETSSGEIVDKNKYTLLSKNKDTLLLQIKDNTYSYFGNNNFNELTIEDKFVKIYLKKQ